MKNLFDKKNYKQSYKIALFSILFFISIAIVNMIILISDHSKYAELINKSGKQRMLSQRIALLSSIDKVENVDNLQDAINEIQSNHILLTKIKLSTELKNIYYNEPHNLDKLLNEFLEYSQKYNFTKNKEDLNHLIEMEEKILKLFDSVVLELEKESKKFSDFMIVIEILIIVLISFLLYFEFLYIFKPILKKIEKETYKEKITKNKLEKLVHQKTKSLEESLEIINHYVFTSKTDLNGVITYVSDAFCELSGYSKEELIGSTHSIIKHPDNPSSAFKKLWETLGKGEQYQGEVKNRRKNGEDFWLNSLLRPEYNEKGKIIGYIAYRKNITHEKTLEELNVKLENMVEKKTKELKHSNERLLKLSQTDALTGIYNRKMLQETLSLEIKKANRHNQVFSIILIDIDHFKKVNDTYGHLTGDNVIKEICNLISDNIRDIDLFARWGGEEFVILLNNQDKYQTKCLAEKIRNKICSTKIDNLDVTCSFGISQFESNDTDELIFKKADDALYKAKESGRNCVIIG